MKTMLLLIALIFASPVFAGSANCTNTQAVTTAQELHLTSADCIIHVNVPTSAMGYVRGYLPEPMESSAGDEFTIENASPFLTESGSYFDEELNAWVYYSDDYTGGVGLEAAYPGSSEESSTFAPGRYVKAVFDGARWQFSDGAL